MELATLWKMEMQYYGKMVCNFREKRLAKNSLRADQAEAYVEVTLGPLLEYDLKYHAELLRTLEACFLYGNQAQKIANALYIHRNTLSYRKQTIKKVLGMDPFLGYNQFRIQMAVVLRRLLVGQLFHGTF